jgi:hypothetical protein
MKHLKYLLPLCLLFMSSLLQAQPEISMKKIQIGQSEKQFKLTKVGHYFVLNGDIIMGDDFPRQRSYVITDPRGIPTNFWPQGYIPIVISPEVVKWDMYKTVLKALTRLNTETNVRFKPRTDEANYIKIEMYMDDPNIGGLSAVGRVGGEQLLFLNRGQGETVVLHELLHALGFWHEQSRADRNTYVHVNLDSVKRGYENNFEIEPGIAIGAYDYKSIMHYGAQAFAISGTAVTIQCKSGNTLSNCTLGGSTLSDKDKEGLNRLFSGNQSLAMLNLREAFNTPIPNTASGPAIENGIYRIKIKNTAKYLDIKDVSKANGALLQQWDQFTEDNQKFAVTSTPSGAYEIKAMHSGRYLSVDQASTQDLATILQWDYANQDNQRFYIYYVESHGGYLIQGKQSRKYLGLLGLNNGGLIIQQTKPVQVFAFERVGNILIEKPPTSTNQLPGRPNHIIQKKKAP